jgi:RND family efflux transporter MFP subunit
MSKRSKWLITSVAVLGLGAGGFFWWSSAAKAKPAPQAEVVVAKKGDLVQSVKATGTVEPEFIVEVKSKASGTVDQVVPQEGDAITKGQLLVAIDPILEKRKVLQAEAQVRIAQAGLSNAASKQAFSKKQLERDSGLLAKGLVSGESVDSSRKEAAVQGAEVRSAAAGILRAKEDLQEAKDRLSETKLYSPIAGTVLERTVQPGQIVASGTNAVNGGTTLLKIADLSRMFVRVKVDEADVARVAPGQPVKLTADALPGKIFDGKVQRVAPQGKIDSNVTVFDVVVEVGVDGRKALKPAMTANVEIEVSSRRGVVLVPLRAVRQSKEAGGKVVTIEVEGQRKVQTGAADSREVEIVAGLSEGERVVLPGDRPGPATAKPQQGAQNQARQMGKLMGGGK